MSKPKKGTVEWAYEVMDKTLWVNALYFVKGTSRLKPNVKLALNIIAKEDLARHTDLVAVECPSCGAMNTITLRRYRAWLVDCSLIHCSVCTNVDLSPQMPDQVVQPVKPESNGALDWALETMVTALFEPTKEGTPHPAFVEGTTRFKPNVQAAIHILDQDQARIDRENADKKNKDNRPRKVKMTHPMAFFLGNYIHCSVCGEINGTEEPYCHECMTDIGGRT